jgi:putative membrane protein
LFFNTLLRGEQMKDLMERFLSETDRNKIEACVREAESRTRGEIVVMVVPASYHYPVAGLLGATAFALPAAVVLTPPLGGLFWAGPFNLWVFLALLIPLFAAFHQAVKRTHILQRWFVNEKEMEAEVREAAHFQFSRKGLYRTREETGVLLYISVFERKVWVLGDRGIETQIPGEQWKAAAAMIVQAIREGRPAEGICRAVGEVDRVLREKLPIRPDNPDELKNLIIEDQSP